MKDRGAWRAAAHGVTKSQTQLSNWTATTDYMGPAFKCQKNFQDPHIMLVKLWVTSWVLPVEPAPHSITRSPRHISGSDLESQRLCNTLTAPCPQLPTSRTSPVADCVCSETLAFVQVQSSFPEGIGKKENPYRHLSRFSDCFLLNVCWVELCTGCLSALFFTIHMIALSFQSSLPLTYQLFIFTWSCVRM